jgi:arylsulfatase A-like enzyme
MRAHAATGLLALAPCLLPGCSDGGAQQGPAAPRNVVLISIDTLRFDHLGAYGYARDVSPAIDALAREGVVFEEAIVQAPWTAPSHASMLTSQYPSALGIGRFADPGRIHPAVETLAETLSAAGLATCAVTENGFVSPAQGMDQGFDVFHMTKTSEEGVATAEAWLAELGPEEPFFLFFHTYDVHQYNPKGEYWDRFVRPYEGKLTSVEPTIARLLQSPDHDDLVATFDAEDWRHVIDRYDGTIAYVDTWMGELFALLERLGRRADTLILLTSDHGEEFGEHDGSGHGFTLYDENVRVPLIVQHRSLAPRRVEGPVGLLDLAPTVTDLLGLATPSAWQGVSLAPVLRGAAAAPPELPVLSEGAHRPFKSIRTATHKYVVSTRQPREQLFDLDRDPGEEEGVSGGEAALRAELRDVLVGLVEENERRLQATGKAAGGPIDEETLRQLEALGYVGGEDEEAGDGTAGEPHVDAARWLETLRKLDPRGG